VKEWVGGAWRDAAARVIKGVFAQIIFIRTF